VPTTLDLTGQRFGELTVIRCAGKDPKIRVINWLCRCDCGTETTIPTGRLRGGLTKSCGCLQRRRTAERSRTHGACSGYKASPEYAVWQAMLRRCHTPTHKMFHHYGGRGIVVCDRWRESFANFLADMGARPAGKYTLERTDNDGPYSPENCRWATWDEQVRNKRNSRLITWNGRTETGLAWSRITGIPVRTIYNRLDAGWPPERILTEARKPVGFGARRDAS